MSKISENAITCFYHPVTILLVDDSKAFLDSLILELDIKDNLRAVTDVSTALKILSSTRKIHLHDAILKDCDNTDTDSINSKRVFLDVEAIRKSVYDKTRFDEIAIAIIDYQMPKMNGLEFARRIKDSSVRKIMLTAAADEKVAISAFNEGVIDQFLSKSHHQLKSELTQTIATLKNHYFSQLSNTLLENLGSRLRSLFKNPQFKCIFDESFKKANAVEYYLLDSSGSFLLLDAYGNPYWLLIKYDTDIKDQLELIEGIEVPASMVSAIKEHDKLLFMASEADYKMPATQWESFLFDAHKLQEGIYYSVQSGHINSSVLDWNQVTPLIAN